MQLCEVVSKEDRNCYTEPVSRTLKVHITVISTMNAVTDTFKFFAMVRQNNMHCFSKSSLMNLNSLFSYHHRNLNVETYSGKLFASISVPKY